MSIDSIERWHQRARMNPTDKDFNVQLGCHFEEFVEMLEALELSNEFGATAGADTSACEAVKALANALKSGVASATVTDRKEFLDSLADQIVTAVGVGHCAGMQMTEACIRVNSSNWSKFDVNGYPMFDANGKVTKGANYRKPDLEGLY